ncbi:MAG: ATP-binding protein [Thermodesulfovibrionales bacterium]|nr:ATP-binding protein [Thermodesulfovibrionales bacterium]
MKTNILLLAAALFIISFFIILNIFFENNFQAEMAQQFSHQQGLLARSIAENLNSAINHIIDETRTLSKLLNQTEPSRKKIIEYSSLSFGDIISSYDIDIKVVNKKGFLLFSQKLSTLNELDRMIIAELQNVREGITRVYLSEDKRILTFASPLQTSIIIVELYLDSLNEKFLLPARLGEKGYAWMVDSDGTLLYHPTQPEMVGRNIFKADRTCFECHRSFDIEKRIIMDSSDIGYSSYIAPSGEDKLIAFSRVRFLDRTWIVCVSIPYSEVMASMKKSMKFHSLLVISIFLTMLVGASAVIVMNSKRIKAEERSRYLEHQRRLVDAVYESKIYLENIIESIQSGILVLDENYYITLVNSAYARLIGKDKEELKGKKFFDICPRQSDDEKGRLKDLIQGAFNGVAGSIKGFPLRKEDRTLYVYVTVSPLVFHDRVSNVIISCDDITEEIDLRDKLREYADALEEIVNSRTEELRTEKEKLDVIMRTVDAGIVLFDTKGSILWKNKKMDEWLGREKVANIIHLLGMEELQKETLQFSKELSLGGRRGIFQVHITPLKIKTGGYQFIALIQDVTELKRLEEQMMHSEKLSALARISAGLAHEIGNPLTSISSYVQLLREMDLGEFANESLEIISRHIARIAEIVRNISSFSKPAKGVAGPVNIREVLDSTISLLRFDKRMKNIDIRIDIPELPHAYADQNQLAQVFTNLIFNAVDAMPDGGMLSISARLCDDFVEISFRDTGTGIPEEYLNKVFDPFFTTKDKGTGLGLSVSFSIVKSFGGDIMVESRPGQGSTFTVRLPVYKGGA